MSVSKLLPAGGANDFNVAITGTNTVVTFTKEYSAGSYTINISGADTTYDIYILNADGSSAGYTNTPSLTATKGFNKMVIIGQTAGVLLSFTYKTTYTSSSETAETAAGPVAVSVSVSSLPNANDTTVLTGLNFATNVTVQFTSANSAYTATSAKVVTRTSATSLTITRPDNMPTDYSPYSLVVTNPGVTAPTGSNSHILSNVITAGSGPSWVTGTTLSTFSKNVAYSTMVSATDSDGGSSITYSIASGSLPTSLSLNGSTGAISGTPTSSINATVTIRATDSGGNYVDRTFTIPNSAPTWTTAAGALTSGSVGTAYTTTVVGTDDGTVSYSVVSGSLPGGLSLNSSTGVISGTPTSGGLVSFTLRATDDNGSTVDRAFSISILIAVVTNVNVSGSNYPSHTNLGVSYGTPYSHAATAITKNKILVTGGASATASGTTPSNTAYTYDISNSTWTQVANMPANRALHGIATVRTNVYVWGGSDNNGTGSWYAGSGNPEKNSSGTTTFTAYSTMWEYSISANTWTAKTPLPAARKQAYGSASNGKIYMFGGGDASNGVASNTIVVYNPSTDSYSSITGQLPGYVTAVSTCTSDKTGYIYFFGGWKDSAAGNSATSQSYLYEFNTSTNVSTLLNNYGPQAVNGQPVGGGGSSITTSHTPSAWFPGNGNDGYVFFMGGQYGSDNQVAFYDISSQAWNTWTVAQTSMISSAFYCANVHDMTLYPNSGVPVAVFTGGYNWGIEKMTPVTGSGTYGVNGVTYTS